MSPKKVKPPQRDLTVVLDTNALYTGSASFFIRQEVGDLIHQHSTQPDLRVKWIVPDVVRHERQFQMLQAAAQMLPTIERLERLLGHNLNITNEILESRVQLAIDQQVQVHGITIHPMSPGAVDWNRLILDAAYRRPPFQLGEKEKGFRDALILETFLQIVAGSPTSRSVAHIALVSNDQLLRDATAARLSAATNVHLLESIEALKDLINTLSSSVDEQYIAAIRARAAEAFFKTDDQASLYYKASVGSSLRETLAAATVKLPTGADKYAVDTWTINPPRFVKKQGQRIYWTSRFEANLRALKSAPSPQLPLRWQPVFTEHRILPEPLRASGQTIGPLLMPLGEEWPSTSIVFGGFGANDQLVATGTASVDVAWSLAVTTSGAFTKLQVEATEFVEVTWS